MKWFVLTLAATTLTTTLGCTVHEEVVAPRPDPVVYVEPGYYYDADYYDVYGVYHPAFYYYCDGHHYYQRDHVPEGHELRPRGGFDPGDRGNRSAMRGPGPVMHGGDRGGGGGPHGGFDHH